MTVDNNIAVHATTPNLLICVSMFHANSNDRLKYYIDDEELSCTRIGSDTWYLSLPDPPPRIHGCAFEIYQWF
jgi:hypothetical protein